MGCSILSEERGVLKGTRRSPRAEGEIEGPTVGTVGVDAPSAPVPPRVGLDEVFADDPPLRAADPMDFFWSGLAPFSFLVACGASVVVFVLAVYLLEAPLEETLILCGSVLAVGLLVLLPLEYYLVNARVAAPIRRLESELVGRSPWRPEGDMLLGSLRRAVGEIRVALRSMDSELRAERERGDDLHARLIERASADRLADQVAEGLMAAESVEQFATEAGKLVRSVWPAEDFLLLHREEGADELRVLAWEHEGTGVDLHSLDGDMPRYRRSSLPAPVKEALRRGFYAESGLPFSQDPAFPGARSFMAMSLEHRGGGAGVMLAVSSTLDPPSAEPLLRARTLFNMGFGRAMYERELGEAEIRDSLTGAFTYDHFLSVVRQEVVRANRYSRPVGCLMIDVDNLRRVNGIHGSAAGDRVVAELAHLVRGTIRSSDILARMTGGRLALLLPEVDAETAMVVAERIRARTEEHAFIVVRGQVERATVSVGVGAHPPFGVTAMSLVDAAERALAEAKNRGRNRSVSAFEASDPTWLDD
jgi:diguanylate cyclase (GGDEF)-like protein